MTISIVLNIVLGILFVIAGFLAVYYQNNAKLKSTVAAFIARAEKDYGDTMKGGQKFQIVVGWLYDLLPAVIRPFVPKSIVSALVQSVFDQLSAYATKKLDELVDKGLAKIGPESPTDSQTAGTVPAAK